MKKVLLILVVLLAGGVAAYLWYSQKPPAAPIPEDLSDKEKLIFFEQLKEVWAENGPRPQYDAFIQAKFIDVKTVSGKVERYTNSTKVRFLSMAKIGDKFVYAIRVNKRERTFSSPSPFMLLYNTSWNIPKSYKNIWGLLTKGHKSHYTQVYSSLERALICQNTNDSISASWIKTVNDNYRHTTHNDLLADSLSSFCTLSPSRYLHLMFGIKEEDVTPVMKSVYLKIKTGASVFVHKTKGVELYKTSYQHFLPKRIVPYFNDHIEKGSVFGFCGYKYHGTNRYIALLDRLKKDTVLCKVDLFDDVLPVMPQTIDYLQTANQCLRSDSITSDDLTLSFIYLAKQLHFNLLHNKENDLTQYGSTINTVLEKAKTCRIGKLGPESTEQVYSDGALPYDLVMAYYNNMDFFIPAWCNYNSKAIRRRRSGILQNNNSHYGYIVAKGNHTPYMPTVKDLLQNADLSTILSGYGLEQIVVDTVSNTLQNNFAYLKQLRSDSTTDKNAILFATNFSYSSIVEQAYPEENLTEGEVDVIAKALREFNNLMANSTTGSYHPDSRKIDIKKNSTDSNTVIVPASINQLGIERRPIKVHIRYQFEMNN